MERITTAQALVQLVKCIKAAGKTIGLVPTMGGLHAGHLSLIDAAKKHSDVTIASLFVNPLQFNENEDFEDYPRNPETDQTKLSQQGCDVLFIPSENELYPFGKALSMQLQPPKAQDNILCSTTRPHFFSGVSTVVLKLFNLVQPNQAYFGEKDYQQLCIIKHMVKDLQLAIEIIAVPTLREKSGLALSSRNQYLSACEYSQAAELYQTMQQVQQRYQEGESATSATHNGIKQLSKKGFLPEYLEIRNSSDLSQSPEQYQDLAQPARLFAAAKLGDTRLIDNINITI